MRLWVDIENPPQVQYLLPVARAFRQRGAEVTVTAKDAAQTLHLLDASGSEFVPVGRSFGSSKTAKAFGVVRRAEALVRTVRSGAPRFVVSSSRPAAIAARRIGIPSFVLCDYEHAELSIYRLTSSYLVFPDAIDSAFFRGRRFPPSRLIPFSGVKEDLSFAHVDLDAAPEHEFPELRDRELVRILFRPPAEESHYFRPRSRALALDLLSYLSCRTDCVVIYVPRYPRQLEYLDRMRWQVEPIALPRAVPFVSLLKAVDMVISSGGTMVREAAYLGLPAYTIFQSDLGSVDQRLADQGKMRLIESAADFDRIMVSHASAHLTADANRGLVDELVTTILHRAEANKAAG